MMQTAPHYVTMELISFAIVIAFMLCESQSYHWYRGIVRMLFRIGIGILLVSFVSDYAFVLFGITLDAFAIIFSMLRVIVMIVFVVGFVVSAIVWFVGSLFNLLFGRQRRVQRRPHDTVIALPQAKRPVRLKREGVIALSSIKQQMEARGTQPDDVDFIINCLGTMSASHNRYFATADFVDVMTPVFSVEDRTSGADLQVNMLRHFAKQYKTATGWPAVVNETVKCIRLS